VRAKTKATVQPIAASFAAPARSVNLASKSLSTTAGLFQCKTKTGEPADMYEQEAERVAEQVNNTQDIPGGSDSASPPDVLSPRTTIDSGLASSSGQLLTGSVREYFEPRFGFDFSQVRVHADAQAAESARSLNARAFAVDHNLFFGASQFKPETQYGRRLVAHELSHVIQQGAVGPLPGYRSPVSLRTNSLSQPSGTALVQREVEFRDVGRGEYSGYARVPELIERLNAMSTGLTYTLVDNQLTYELKEGGTLNYFDTQMQGFIDNTQNIRLRFTNRHGRVGTHGPGPSSQVDVDAWTSGYVDIDDLLASTDLGLQSVLVHFIHERLSTSNYTRRIGTSTFTVREFNRVHAAGIEQEVALLQDYFVDPSIRLVRDSPSRTIRREYRNDRGDTIRRMVTIGEGEERGINAMSIRVIASDGTEYTAEEYRELLERERGAEAAPVGAAE
jgi:hypothetical protein